MKSLIIDTDGVIRNFLDKTIEVYKRTYPEHQVEEVTNWALHRFFPIGKRVYDFIYKEHTVEIFTEANLYEGAIEFLNGVKKDYRIILCSSQPNILAMRHTVMWYELNKIPYDDIVFTTDKWKLHADFLIDDSPKQLDMAIKNDCGIKCIIPFIQPWNIEYIKGLQNYRHKYNPLLGTENIASKEKFRILTDFFMYKNITFFSGNKKLKFK